MPGFRQSLANMLIATGMYRPVRRVYDRVRNRGQRGMERRRQAFYGQFIEPGDLVFDIGANIGRRAETFLEMGATVVAVEPNPQCVREIRASVASPNLHVVEAACGAEDGDAELHICDEHQDMSTLSSDYIGRTQSHMEQFAETAWNRTVTVPVTTLDTLIDRFGEPAFVKIDVEGFEPEVMAGLSRPVRALSFEYHTTMPESGADCLRALSCLGAYEYNFCWGETVEPWFKRWLDGAGAGTFLESDERLADIHYGDVYARLVPAIEHARAA